MVVKMIAVVLATSIAAIDEGAVMRPRLLVMWAMESIGVIVSVLNSSLVRFFD